MLVPLLAFDARGYRLGYGGGFYDRTIAQLRNQKPVLTIGIAFDEQRVDAVPHVDYDQRARLGPHAVGAAAVSSCSVRLQADVRQA